MANNEDQQPSESLMHCTSGPLSRNSQLFSVGSLERAFLDRFPIKDGENWDNNGLIVGDRVQNVTKVAFTLDPTVQAIKAAHEQGANVLVTHHPVFIESPDRFEPKDSPCLSSGSAVWAAIEHRVALISLHTVLDVSIEAQRILPRMLSLDFERIIQPIAESSKKGYGQLSAPKKEETPFTLEQLAARCVSVFGRQPRVYGDFSTRLERIATCTGSASSLLNDCIDQKIDCLVCGEIHYHDALNISQSGMTVIDLGHDVSEWPLVAVLAATARDIGIAESDIMIIDQQDNWTTPETIRM